ncbi:uncharacterized protein LOC108444540 isoform X1 [Pygocentrus nattereri]|uniref:Ig-like domain-containing protein n=2 Tax=Pygocentrus nattereri TaxID=42514 RepID=A0A3B4EN68_PYGNA|nr:uncharacterized protein LOC108444540 isoform X1 [Pygocentrus nattereri]
MTIWKKFWDIHEVCSSGEVFLAVRSAQSGKRPPAHTSSEMTLNIMTSLLYTATILWPAVCVSFLSADSQISISARVGSSAVLPCQLRNVPTETPQVEWQNNAETVFERFGQDLHQADGYTDRVDVPEHNLLKGNCSLELKNIRLDDEGVYESYLILKEGDRSKRVFIQRVKLSVEETDQEFVKGFLEDDIATQQALDLTGIIAFILILCILFP